MRNACTEESTSNHPQVVLPEYGPSHAQGWYLETPWAPRTSVPKRCRGITPVTYPCRKEQSPIQSPRSHPIHLPPSPPIPRLFNIITSREPPSPRPPVLFLVSSMRERHQPVQPSEVERLLHYATSALPFCSTHGQACVSLPLGRDGRQFCPVRSSRFRDWLLSSYLSESDLPPGDRSLRRVLRAIEARARRSGPIYPLHLRVAARGHPHRPNSLALDLANHCGDVVEISPHGWEVTPFTDLWGRIRPTSSLIVDRKWWVRLDDPGRANRSGSDIVWILEFARTVRPTNCPSVLECYKVDPCSHSRPDRPNRPAPPNDVRVPASNQGSGTKTALCA